MAKMGTDKCGHGLGSKPGGQSGTQAKKQPPVADANKLKSSMTYKPMPPKSPKGKMGMN